MKKKLTKICILSSALLNLSAHAGQGWNVYIRNQTKGEVNIRTADDSCWYHKGLGDLTVQPGQTTVAYTEEKNSGGCNDLFFRVRWIDFDVTAMIDPFNSVSSMFHLSTGSRSGTSGCSVWHYEGVSYNENWCYFMYDNGSGDSRSFTPMTDGSQYQLYLDVLPSGQTNFIIDHYAFPKPN